MESEDPEELCCPECRVLIKNATQLPCCLTCLCRPCAYKKLMLNRKSCWFSLTEACLLPIQLSQLAPALEMRELIEDYKNGGTKYKERDKTEPTGAGETVGENGDEKENEEERQGDKKEKEGKDVEEEEVVEMVENIARLENPHKPIAVVKQEAVDQEEYLEAAGTSFLSQQLVTPTGVKAELTEASLQVEGEYFESPAAAGQLTVKQEPGYGPGGAGTNPGAGPGGVVKPSIKEEEGGMPSVKEEEGGMLVQDFLPHTPSSSRTDPHSSGYWSDDTKGPSFGKLRWDAGDQQTGVIESWVGGVLRQVHVSRYEVKCGAESGDLVEFTLGDDPNHGKAAKRVKLVEKGLPASEADQIRGQDNLKRSLELSAGIADVDGKNKRIKSEQIIDAAIHLPTMSSSYQDIVAEEEDEGVCGEDPMLPLTPHQLAAWGTTFLPTQLKAELQNVTDVPSEDCICNKPIMNRCGVCPAYFLRSEEQHAMLEGESVTFVARIEGNEGECERELAHVRQLPYPFTVPKGAIEFQLLSKLGSGCVIKKISPVFHQKYVFVSLMNTLQCQVSICPGELVGICQAHHTQDCDVSENFILEPPDKQYALNLPVYIQPTNFSRYEGQTVCGFGDLGFGDTNYRHCLVRVSLRPELESKFRLVRSDMTVQVRRNVWLELIPVRGKFANMVPKDGLIGYASSIMTSDYVEDMIDPRPPPSPPRGGKESGRRGEQQPDQLPQKSESKREMSNTDTSAAAAVDEEEEEGVDPYAEMMLKVDMAIISNSSTVEKGAINQDLVNKSFRGVISQDALTLDPGSVEEVTLFLVSDDPNFTVKNLLRMRVEVTNNEEFHYYNNCYTIDRQVTTVRSSVCRQARATRPSVKVRLRNPRQEPISLLPGSPVALVKIHVNLQEGGTRGPAARNAAAAAAQSAPPLATLSGTVAPAVHPSLLPPPLPPAAHLLNTAANQPTTGVSAAAAAPPTAKRGVLTKTFSAKQVLERSRKKLIRSWERILAEDTFAKSLLVEERFPYFSSGPQRPKIPFGIKDGSELTMRVGVTQDSRPLKVLDRVSGVYTCTICDQVILDKYSLQDHIYSVKHKNNIQLVQVIAGLEERLYMNRPVIQEMLDQFQTAPLLGLDHLFEVLQENNEEPVYHCALCNTNSNTRTIILHVTGVDHNLKFLKEYFPLAWNSGGSLIDNWTEVDLAAYEAILGKIDAVHGRKRPSIVANETQLEEAVDKIPTGRQYATRRAELDEFFKGLKKAAAADRLPAVERSAAVLKQKTHAPVVVGSSNDAALAGSADSLLLAGQMATHQKQQQHHHHRLTGVQKTVTRTGVNVEPVDVPPAGSTSVLCRILTTAGTAQLAIGQFVQVAQSVICRSARVRTGLSRVLVDEQVPYVHVTVSDPPPYHGVKLPVNTELVIVKWKK